MSNIIDLSIKAPPSSGTGWTFKDDVYAILSRADVIVTGNNEKSNRRVAVDDSAVGVRVTLDNATITLTRGGKDHVKSAALDIGEFAHVTLILTGSSTFSGMNCLNARNRSKLTVEGSGGLTVDGFDFGIDAEQLIVNNGKINATATHQGKAIKGRKLIINGGEVIAKPRKEKGYSTDVTNAIYFTSILINGGRLEAESVSSYTIAAMESFIINGGLVSVTVAGEGVAIDLAGRAQNITINGGTVTVTALTKKGVAIGDFTEPDTPIKFIMNGNAVVSATNLKFVSTDEVTGGTLTVGGKLIFDKPGPSPVIPKDIPACEREGYYADDGFEMMLVKPGTFMMGCACKIDKCKCSSGERPVHQVTLTDDFYIGVYPITQKQWKDMMGNNPARDYWEEKKRRRTPTDFIWDEDCPVNAVTWEEVQEFIAKLNERTGKYYRLPTEAEWEFAARGGNLGKGYLYSGSDDLKDVKWFGSVKYEPRNTPDPIGIMPPNELGIHDMTGIVLEWCNDVYDDYTEEPKENPIGALPVDGEYNKRVVRGVPKKSCTLTHRDNIRQTYRETSSLGGIGFRLAMSKPDGVIAKAIEKSIADAEAANEN